MEVSNKSNAKSKKQRNTSSSRQMKTKTCILSAKKIFSEFMLNISRYDLNMIYQNHRCKYKIKANYIINYELIILYWCIKILKIKKAKKNY